MKKQHEKIKEIFEENGGFARTRDIAEEVHLTYLYELVDRGRVEKVKRGLYRWNEGDYSTEKELAEVAHIVPRGVVCLLSALSFHELSTADPWKYSIAIPREAHKPALPDYPPVKIYCFSQNQFETGIEEVEVKHGTVQVYDPEKTICDCVRYRKKIGQDVVKEAVGNYVKRRDRDLDKLLDCAEVTRISGVIERYLEVLV